MSVDTVSIQIWNSEGKRCNRKKEGELVYLDWKKVGKDVDKKDYRGSQSSVIEDKFKGTEKIDNI